MIVGPPPEDDQPFATWGQLWLTMDLLPRALSTGRAFWHVDNGYWSAPVNGVGGYHRICYRGMTPIQWTAPADRSMSIPVAPWRKSGSHILLALPSGNFGKAIGITHDDWFKTIEARVQSATDRPIVVRRKDAASPIAKDLENCWALVTHSSNAAVDAVLAGIPAFVEPSCPTAPLGNTDVRFIETPHLAHRQPWLASLSCQQFTKEELASGLAYNYLREVRRIVDDGRSRHVQGPAEPVDGPRQG